MISLILLKVPPVEIIFTSFAIRKLIDDYKIFRKDNYVNEIGNNILEVCYKSSTKQYDQVENVDAYVRDVKILGYIHNNKKYENYSQLFETFEGEISEETFQDSRNISYLPYYNLYSIDDINYQMFKGTFNIPPGTMQYKLNIQDVLNLNVQDFTESNVDYKTNFELVDNSLENLNRLTPDTRTGNNNQWELIFVIKETNNDDIEEEICLKGALLNLSNKSEIALMSSLNEFSAKKYIAENHKTVTSKDEQWKICKCKMIANLFFWDELKKRVFKLNEIENEKNNMLIQDKNMQLNKEIVINKIARNPQLQNEFRQKIIARFSNKCIITGMNGDVCDACHIKPFCKSSDEECFDVNNGLLFNCVIHKLFDMFDISINPNTLRFEISKKCKNYNFINKYQNMYISEIEKYDEIKNFLKFHYEIFINQ